MLRRSSLTNACLVRLTASTGLLQNRKINRVYSPPWSNDSGPKNAVSLSEFSNKGDKHERIYVHAGTLKCLGSWRHKIKHAG